MSDARILIVEDEGIEALALQQTLTGLGYSVPELVLSGEEAIKAVHETAPDLVLMDIMLHGEMDGIAAAKQIRSCFDVPVVYITAYADEETLARAKATGPYGYIIKPFRERELHIIIEMALYKHKMEQRLKESERWLSTTLRSIGDAVLATDQDGRIVFMNAVSESLLGWRLEEVKGKPSTDYFRIIDAKTRELVESPVTKVLREGVAVGSVHDTLLVTRSGKEIPIDDSAAPIRDEKGRNIGVVLVFRDVTDRKLAEEALRRSNDRYRRLAEKLREADRRKNQFIAVLSHELRNPLAVISNCLSILERVSPDGDQAERAKQIIQRQVKYLSRLVEDLLDITRIERGKIELQWQILELNALVRHTVDDYRSICQKNCVDLKAKLPSDPIYVKADQARLTQVVSNLLQNALKFSRKDGNVQVSVEKDPAKSQAIIRVIDDGIGIAPDVLPHIFEPYMQAARGSENNRGGLGLGLALTKGLVELHGGQIHANSSGVNQGAEFVIRLPVVGKSGDEVHSGEREFSHSHRRILIIDDNVDMAESLRQLLELMHHEAITAYDGPDGIARAQDFRPEVVLCDIGLPHSSGYDVARALRAHEELRGAYLVALSGYAMPEDLQKAQDAGFNCHLAKPVDLEKLERILASIPQPVTQ